MASESAGSVFGSSSYGDLRSRDSWPGGIWEPSTLVRPVGRPEDEEDASDFEPEANGEEGRRRRKRARMKKGDNAGGEVEAPPKRKRSDRDNSEDDGGDGGGERMMRDPPSDRPRGPARSWSEQ